MGFPVLCYHQVGTEAEFGRRLVARPDRVEAHARFLRRRGPSDLLDQWPPRGAFAMTFDDGFLGAVRDGAAVLERADARGVFYVIAGRVGVSDADWDGGRESTPRPLADWDDLKRLVERGHAVGNHSWSHARLDRPGTQDEIPSAQRELEAHGLRPRSFCWPYGAEGPIPEGFATVTTLRKGIARADDDPMTLRRVVMAYSDGVAGLVYKLHVRPLLRRATR